MAAFECSRANDETRWGTGAPGSHVHRSVPVQYLAELECDTAVAEPPPRITIRQVVTTDEVIRGRSVVGVWRCGVADIDHARGEGPRFAQVIGQLHVDGIVSAHFATHGRDVAGRDVILLLEVLGKRAEPITYVVDQRDAVAPTGNNAADRGQALVDLTRPAAVRILRGKFIVVSAVA